MRTIIPVLLITCLIGFCATAAAQPVSTVSEHPVELLATEIPAGNRNEFERWVDERVGKIALHRKGDKPLTPDEYESLICELHNANIDVESFLVRGSKNYDFPKMLYYNEFFKKPLYYLNPKHSLQCVLHRAPHACNAQPDGSIAHSSFYTNTVIESYTPDVIVNEYLSFQPQGAMEVTKVKKGGTSEGLWIKDAAGKTYILVFDPPFAPEMTTSAEYIGSTLLRIAGYHVPKTCVCHVQGTGDAMYDGRRAVATIALDDFKGGWRYHDFRDRREIRALQLFAAWISNVDQTEQNTGLTLSDAGVHRHYVLDFGSSLGSFTFRPQIARLGWTRLFDAYQQFTQPLYDNGIRKVPWEAPYSVHSVSVGYFTANFDPDRWQPFYSNMGFIEITEADRVWAAEKIARFTDEQIRTVVALAGYTHPSDAEHVACTLIARRDIIVGRYLGTRNAPFTQAARLEPSCER